MAVQADHFQFDAQYIRGLQEGDEKVQAHFCSYFRKPVMGMACNRLRSSHLAEDAAQVTLMRMLQYFRSGKGIDEPAKLPGFAAAFCRNICREIERHEWDFDPLPQQEQDPVHPQPSQENDLIFRELVGRAHGILAKLPERDRKILVMALVEEWDYARIGRELGVTQQYVRVLLHRAIKAAVRQGQDGDKARARGTG